MCWQCDNPDKTLDDYVATLRADISVRGWVVQHVEADRAPYAYTIGLHRQGLPEFLVTGLSAYHGAWVLNTFTRRTSAGKTPTPGTRVRLPAGAILELVEVAHPDAHMDVAIAVEGPDVRAIQLVWADDRRRCPWGSDFDDGRRRQPVLDNRCRTGG